jgi:hypothetical protein
LQGFFARREPEFADNRRDVRPSSSVEAKIERKNVWICRSFAEPSDGLEPSTPSLPSSDEAGTAGKRGSRRPKKSRKTEESAEDE